MNAVPPIPPMDQPPRAIVHRGHLTPTRVVDGQSVHLPPAMFHTADTWLQVKRGEIDQANTAIRSLRTLGASPARIRRLRERVRFLKRFVGALERGFVPIPRFDSQDVDIDVDEFPSEALVAMASAKTLRLFDEVRFVPGTIADSRPGTHTIEGRRGRTWTRKRLPARDPLVVGIIRTPEHRVANPNGWGTISIPAREETFLIAWWRPEDERDWTMF